MLRCALALLLLQRRFGLGPMKALSVQQTDIVLARRADLGMSVAFMRLGLHRGTKVRQPQVRARDSDPVTNWLVQVVWHYSRDGTELSGMCSWAVVIGDLQKNGSDLGHWCRAHVAWASWRWI